jgi:hypothetical protein
MVSKPHDWPTTEQLRQRPADNDVAGWKTLLDELCGKDDESDEDIVPGKLLDKKSDSTEDDDLPKCIVRDYKGRDAQQFDLLPEEDAFGLLALVEGC